MAEDTVGQIRRFQDLVAWKSGFRLLTEVYRATESFSKSALYELTDQIRRSANSTIANIAEGFGRYTPREYLKSLYYARGSLSETESHLEAAHAVGFIGKDEFDRLQALCCETRKVLQGLIRHVQSTTKGFPQSTVRDDQTDYLTDPVCPESVTANWQL